MGLTFRDFVIVLCGLGVIYNSACAYFLTQLFEQSAPIPIDISLYTYFATFINILGVCGTIKNHVFTLTIFSNFLILDTLIYNIPRFILLYFFYSIRDVFCDYDASPPISTTLPWAMVTRFIPTTRGADHIDIGMLGNSRLSIDKKCNFVFQLVVAIMVVGLVVTTFVQMFFAILVRQHAHRLAAKQAEKAKRAEKTADRGHKEKVVVIRAPEDTMDQKSWGRDEDIKLAYDDIEKGY